MSSGFRCIFLGFEAVTTYTIKAFAVFHVLLFSAHVDPVMKNLVDDEVHCMCLVIFLFRWVLWFMRVHIPFSISFFPFFVGRPCGIKIRGFVIRLGFRWLHQFRWLRGLDFWVFKVNLEWCEDINNLFLCYCLWCHVDSGMGDVLYRKIGSIDDDGFVSCLSELERSFPNRFVLVAVLLHVVPLNAEEDIVSLINDFWLLS